jgi:hypothetical protein
MIENNKCDWGVTYMHGDGVIACHGCMKAVEKENAWLRNDLEKEQTKNQVFNMPDSISDEAKFANKLGKQIGGAL